MTTLYECIRCVFMHVLDVCTYVVGDDTPLVRLSQCANRGALVTNKHGERNARGREDVAAAPNVLVCM